MITFTFRIAGRKRVTVRAHCSSFAVCIRLCHSGTEKSCIPLQANDDDSIQTVASQTVVSHCGIDRSKKRLEERDRERQRWKRTEMGSSVIGGGLRLVSQTKCYSTAGHFASPLRGIVLVGLGGNGEKVQLFYVLCDYYGPLLSDLSYVCKEWNDLSLQLAPSMMYMVNLWVLPLFGKICSQISYYCLCICDYVKTTPTRLPLS